MEKSNLLPEDLKKWRDQLKQTTPARVLREIGQTYKLGRPELAMLLGDLFDKSPSTAEVQAVWHWDLAEVGRGFTDVELNERLSILLVRAEN